MTQIEGIDVRKGSQSSVFLSAQGLKIAIDPWQASGDKADIILMTHDHYDHCDPSSVEALRKEDTLVLGPSSCSSKINNLRVISPGETLEDRGVKIEWVHAYNIGKPFHKKGECLGYVITLAGKRIYHAGDTDRIPEMKGLGRIDIALLPVGGTYTMTAEEAAHAANQDIRPKTAVPIHYGDVAGSRKDAEKFRQLCECEVAIL